MHYGGGRDKQRRQRRKERLAAHFSSEDDVSEVRLKAAGAVSAYLPPVSDPRTLDARSILEATLGRCGGRWRLSGDARADDGETERLASVGYAAAGASWWRVVSSFKTCNQVVVVKARERESAGRINNNGTTLE